MSFEMKGVPQATNRTRVLLVEDDLDNLEALSIILSWRYAVFSHVSAADALHAVAAAKPDVLVLDIGMRPIDGLQCLTAVRSLPGYREIPAIALTGYARAEERERFLAAGFQVVVPKPLPNAETLFELISSLSKRSRTVARGAAEAPHRAAAVAVPEGNGHLDRLVTPPACSSGESERTGGRETP